MSFLSSLEWRRAVKHFSSETSPIDVKPIINAMVQAPSSFGLQPYKFVVVSNRDLLTKLRPACYDQPQIEGCQTLIVICARINVYDRIDQLCDATGIIESKSMMTGFVS
jgi:nitroreductase